MYQNKAWVREAEYTSAQTAAPLQQGAARGLAEADAATNIFVHFKINPYLRGWILALLGGALLLQPAHVLAEFSLNFQRLGSGALLTSNGYVEPEFTCNHPIYGSSAVGTPGSNGDPCSGYSQSYGKDSLTPIVQEAISYGGKPYWHQIIGDPSSGFASEVYIERAINGLTNKEAYHTCSASMGDSAMASGCSVSSYSDGNPYGNGLFPLHPNDKYTGSSSGSPDKTVIRTIIDDAKNGMTAEFLKANLLKKPKITQNVLTPEIRSEFVIDMSSTYYGNINIPATMTNRLDLLGDNPDLLPEKKHFDVGLDGQHLNVTGGRYTYSTGSGTLGSGGTYTYIDGGYDPTSADYLYFRNTNENPGGMMCNNRNAAAECDPAAAGAWNLIQFQ